MPSSAPMWSKSSVQAMGSSRQPIRRRTDDIRPLGGGCHERAPLDRTLAAAETDDEPVTEEEHRDIESSREWFKHNDGIPFEHVVAELGLTMEEVTNYKEPS